MLVRVNVCSDPVDVDEYDVTAELWVLIDLLFELSLLNPGFELSTLVSEVLVLEELNCGEVAVV